LRTSPVHITVKKVASRRIKKKKQKKNEKEKEGKKKKIGKM
jgi:hypothetical protein